jgi:D-alanyl-D-alanine carboxypeptidase
MRHIAIRFTFIISLISASAFANASQDTKNIKAYVDDLLAHVYTNTKPGIVIAVSKGDKVLYSGAKGLANIEFNVPLEPSQILRIASVTKQIAAAAILKYVDDGKIHLEDPLSKFLPDYPNGKNITVLQLLNHTSGIKSYTNVKGMMSGPIRLDVTTQELVDSFKDLPPVFEPGADWSYNNSGYVLLGAILESVSGKAWHQHLQDSIFEPFNMKSTQFGGDAQLISKKVSGYSNHHGKIIPATFLSMTQPHAAGALVSNPLDLIAWNNALHSGKVLKPATYQLMITPQGEAKKARYGFGISKGQLREETILEHGGGIPGFSSYLLYLPDSEISVAVIRNTDSSNSPINHVEIALRVAAYALGKPFPGMVALDISEESLKEYEGQYQVEKDSFRVLEVVDGHLTSTRTGGKAFKLVPVARDQFMFFDELNMLQMIRNSSGTITGMQLVPARGKSQPIAPLIEQ